MAELFEMTRLLRRLVWFSLAASLLIAGTMGTFYILERDARIAASLATDRETGIRGYQLTHDQKSLVPEIVGRAQLPYKLDSLAVLTASDSDQSKGVRAIAVSLTRWENQFADPALRGTLSGETVLAGSLTGWPFS